jgi:hypothetical protein
MKSTAKRFKHPLASITVDNLVIHLLTENEALCIIMTARVDLSTRKGKKKATIEATEPEIAVDPSPDPEYPECGLM